MRKLTSKEIKAGAERFRRALEEEAARRAEAPIPRFDAPGRVRYKNRSLEPRVVEAKVNDATGHTWTATGPTTRDAFQAVLTQLEEAAGAGDETARTLLGVIERAPNRNPPRRGPAQGGLL
jgi:hypothetical protein